MDCVSEINIIIMNELIKSHHVYGKRNTNIIQYTCYSLRVMRDWLITAGKLITEKNPKQNKQKKEIYKIY